jgi:hypothetical protein
MSVVAVLLRRAEDGDVCDDDDEWYDGTKATADVMAIADDTAESKNRMMVVF